MRKIAEQTIKIDVDIDAEYTILHLLVGTEIDRDTFLKLNYITNDDGTEVEFIKGEPYLIIKWDLSKKKQRLQYWYDPDLQHEYNPDKFFAKLDYEAFWDFEDSENNPELTDLTE